MCDTRSVCVCSFRSSFSIPKGISSLTCGGIKRQRFPHKKQHTEQCHKHKTQRTNASCSLARCLAESKSATNPTEGTPDDIQADFPKKEPYWSKGDHIRDRITDRAAVGLSLPAASIVAPIEGSKTSKAGTFRALGRDGYILKLYSFSCTVRS